MSTRSLLAVRDGDKILVTQCRWDGYPEYMLKHLKNFEGSRAKRLVEGGYLSYIEGTKVYYQEPLTPCFEYTGDDPTELLDIHGVDYMYINNGQHWEELKNES